MNTTRTILLLTGLTASGKSGLALEIAKRIPSNIINSDSMQVYKEIPIITASPKDIKTPPHHLYQIINGNESFSAFRMVDLIATYAKKALSENVLPIILGGTPMYNMLLLNGISLMPDVKPSTLNDAALLMEKIGREDFFKQATKLDPQIGTLVKQQDTQRLLRSYSFFVENGRSIFEFQRTKVNLLSGIKIVSVCLQPDKKIVQKKAKDRAFQMLEEGAIEEVEKLLEMDYEKNSSIMKAIGVREISAFLCGKVKKEALGEEISKSTNKYIKHQNTWFNNSLANIQKIKDPDHNFVLQLLNTKNLH